MHQIRNLFLLGLLFVMPSCIKQFHPVLDEQDTNKFVVYGRVTNIPGWQEVTVSLSSPVYSPEFIPVTGCVVQIIDDQGNEHALEEYTEGKYRLWMNAEDLVPGRSYRVKIFTSQGVQIVSDFDKMEDGPLLDSVYYSIEDVPNPDPGNPRKGIQFYLDLDASGFDSRYYKWEISETWEYKAARPAEYYYFKKQWYQIYPPDESRRVCWITKPIPEIFTLSTMNLSTNAYVRYPLHFVDGYSSTRLGILYSIMVKQFTLSETAFHYFDKLRNNSSTGGGLYYEQPLSIEGNLHNLTNDQQEVLGYFYTAAESGKRYFYSNIEGVALEFSAGCIEYALPISGWAGFNIFSEPTYYYYNEEGELRILHTECIDCRYFGGKLAKPDFWP